MAKKPSTNEIRRGESNVEPWIKPAQMFLHTVGTLAPSHTSAKIIAEEFAKFKSSLSTKSEKVHGCTFILNRAARSTTSWVYPPHITLPAGYIVAYAVPTEPNIEIVPDAFSYRALMQIPNRDSLYLQQPQILRGILGHMSAEIDPLQRVKGCARITTSTFRYNKPNLEDPEKDVRLPQMKAAVEETISSFKDLGANIEDFQPLITVYNHTRLVLPQYERQLEEQYISRSQNNALSEKDRQLLFEATLYEANPRSNIYAYAKRELAKKMKLGVSYPNAARSTSYALQ